jgi:membrane fusion protein, multidrug efflux system
MSQASTTYREDIASRPAVRGRSRRQLLRWGLMAGGVLAVVVGGGFYWMSGGRWVDTDDAYVQADSMTMSTDVSGIVLRSRCGRGRR